MRHWPLLSLVLSNHKEPELLVFVTQISLSKMLALELGPNPCILLAEEFS